MMTEYKVDAGTEFGLWDDPTSRFMYFDAMPFILTHVNTTGNVADYGGANGLLKRWIPHSISIDIDATKQPDITDDILTHQGDYDLIVIRYVLHYLNPKQRVALFEHIASFHAGNVLVIQFTNDGEDYIHKYENSYNEDKYFLTREDLFALTKGYDIQATTGQPYTVTAEFYANRLGNPNGKPHGEVCRSILMRRIQCHTQ